ncbi:protease complex subunit PrcB family protein [Dethiothermospora halolimnae]|uniref:protease complex subunit PrcB family protein n=1 Tax=Dethiothermospora halolimnae TaxID=3114390 RepID=UPI003CCC41F1
MKKQIITGVLVLGLSMSIVGCDTDGTDEPNNSGNQQENIEQGEEQEVKYEFVGDIPDNLIETINNIKNSKGYKVLEEDDDGTIVYIGVGEKPTGGYNIEVEKIDKKNDTINIEVKEISPGQEDMVTQILTYPSVVLKIKDEFENIKVTNSKGESFEKIETKS